MTLINARKSIFSKSNNAFIIAEAGVNHNGQFELAKQLVIEAKKAGADCVKFQTFSADRVVTQDAPKAHYQTIVTDPGEPQVNMLRKLELKQSYYVDLLCMCKELDILFSSTPYNEEDLDFLDSLDVPLIKAASIHIAEPRFLQRMAETGRPLVVSTGMSNWNEIDEAVNAIRSTGNEDFVLLQCTTNYPSSLADCNLRAMVSMRHRFDCKVGYSDHTEGHISSIGAVAMGACLVEKHLTLNRAFPGPDHFTSETPEEFAGLVKAIRELEVAMGSAEKKPTEAEVANLYGMRRSLSARRNIPKGSLLQDCDLTSRRPMTGIPPREWSDLLGSLVLQDIPSGKNIPREALATIRIMKVMDIPAIEELLQSEEDSYLEHFTSFTGPDELQRQFSVAKNDLYYTLSIGDRQIGFYCLRGFDAGFSRPSFGLYVSSASSNIGIGSAALDHAIQTCKSRKDPSIMLKVSSNHYVRTMYESRGFEVHGLCPVTGHLIMYKDLG